MQRLQDSLEKEEQFLLTLLEKENELRNSPIIVNDSVSVEQMNNNGL